MLEALHLLANLLCHLLEWNLLQEPIGKSLQSQVDARGGRQPLLRDAEQRRRVGLLLAADDYMAFDGLMSAVAEREGAVRPDAARATFNTHQGPGVPSGGLPPASTPTARAADNTRGRRKAGMACERRCAERAKKKVHGAQTMT